MKLWKALRPAANGGSVASLAEPISEQAARGEPISERRGQQGGTSTPRAYLHSAYPASARATRAQSIASETHRHAGHAIATFGQLIKAYLLACYTADTHLFLFRGEPHVATPMLHAMLDVMTVAARCHANPRNSWRRAWSISPVRAIRVHKCEFTFT